jgi:hypothetical protein
VLQDGNRVLGREVHQRIQAVANLDDFKMHGMGCGQG